MWANLWQKVHSFILTKHGKGKIFFSDGEEREKGFRTDVKVLAIFVYFILMQKTLNTTKLLYSKVLCSLEVVALRILLLKPNNYLKIAD